MTRVPYQIRLTGLEAPEGAISMAALVDLCQAVMEGAARALRLQAEGVSTRRGPAPEWIREATNFEVDGLHAGSTVLSFDAPLLEDTTLFSGDGAPPEEFGPAETALSIFSQVVEDVERGDMESPRVDRGVLKTLTRFQQLGQGVRLEISPREQADQTEPWARPFTISQETIAAASRLQRQTPPDRAVLLTGRLVMIEHGDARFTLALDDGGRVKGSLEGEDVTERLRELWGHHVVVQGRARYTPSGRLRFVDASVARTFEPGDEMLTSLTAPQAGPLPGDGWISGTSLDSLRGTWPGDETADELLRALRHGSLDSP